MKILLKDVKEPSLALQMRVAKEVSDKASRTYPYPRRHVSSNLINTKLNDIAGFCIALQKLLPHHHHAESIG
jgi:hypothetical protein